MQSSSWQSGQPLGRSHVCFPGFRITRQGGSSGFGGFRIGLGRFLLASESYSNSCIVLNDYAWVLGLKITHPFISLRSRKGFYSRCISA